MLKQSLRGTAFLHPLPRYVSIRPKTGLTTKHGTGNHSSSGFLHSFPAKEVRERAEWCPTSPQVARKLRASPCFHDGLTCCTSLMPMRSLFYAIGRRSPSRGAAILMPQSTAGHRGQGTARRQFSLLAEGEQLNLPKASIFCSLI